MGALFSSDNKRETVKSYPQNINYSAQTYTPQNRTTTASYNLTYTRTASDNLVRARNLTTARNNLECAKTASDNLVRAKNAYILYNAVLNQTMTNCQWSSVSSKATFFQLVPYTQEFNEIEQFFKRFMHRDNLLVRKIERVQNVYLMGQYWLKKEEYRSKRIHFQEKLLFHGTKASNVLSICEDNFDWRKCGAGTGHRFGKGVCFSPKSSYAKFYCENENQVMFLAKVLVGNECEGNKYMELPDPGCDTSKKPDGSVLVKYYDSEFYPAYVIHFSAKIIRHKNNPYFLQNNLF